jgi:hypothetical protein
MMLSVRAAGPAWPAAARQQSWANLKLALTGSGCTAVMSQCSADLYRHAGGRRHWQAARRCRRPALKHVTIDMIGLHHWQEHQREKRVSWSARAPLVWCAWSNVTAHHQTLRSAAADHGWSRGPGPRLSPHWQHCDNSKPKCCSALEYLISASEPI